jgi:hypothetical protein
LLTVVVVLGKRIVAQVRGDPATGLVDTRGAGAEDHPDAVTAVAGDGLLDIGLDLQGGRQQQLVVATGLLNKRDRDVRQRASHGGDGQRTLRHPTAFGLHARGVACEQRAGNACAIVAQRADQPQCIKVGIHFEALPSSGLTTYFSSPLSRVIRKIPSEA